MSAHWRRILGPLLLFVIFLVLTQIDDVVFAHLPKSWAGVQVVVGYVGEVGLWFCGAYLAVRLVDVYVWDRLRQGGNTVPRLLVDLVAAMFFAVATSCVISVVFEQSLTGIWATSGVVGVIVGFALRSIILDVFIGLAINFERPYKIGDWIKVGDATGRVVEINWRTTRLLREEGSTYVIPNSVLGQTRLENYSMPAGLNRFQTFVTIDFAVPVERARRILLASVISAYDKESSVKRMRPQVLVDAITDLGISYKLRYWFTPWDKMSPSSARDRVLTSVLTHLQYAGITPAYPKQDSYQTHMPRRHLDTRSVEDRVALLSKNPLFRMLTHTEREGLAKDVLEVRFQAGDVLIRQGEQGASMFILIEGLLDVYVEGREQRLARMKPGKYFGELSLLTGSPRSATVKARTEGMAFEIPKVAITHLLEQREEVAALLSEVMAKHQTRSGTAFDDESAERVEEARKSRASQILARITTFFRG